MAHIVSIPPVSPHLEQTQKLVYNDALDTSSIQNILFISCKVVESQQFFDSANSNTFPIIYSPDSVKNELNELLRKKFKNGIKRIAFAFHDPLNGDEYFLDNKSFFHENDLIENQTTFSENVSFLTNLISEFKVENCDFLACNSLQYSNWKKYYDLLNKMTNVACGASNDNTGNLQYGADWVMENTNENVKDIYFTNIIDNYTSFLVIFTVDSLNYSTNGSNATVTGLADIYPANITIPSTVTNDGTTYNVTIIGSWAFFGKVALTSVTIGSNVTTIGSSAFYGCEGLTTITIPNSVTTIKNYAFLGCTNLTSVTIGSGLTTLDGYNIFEDVSSLSSFVVDASNANFSSFLGILFNKNQTTLIIYPPGRTGTSYTFPYTVTKINHYAFRGCVGLTSFTIPPQITDVGNGAFQGCTGLTSVTIEDSVGNGITSLSYGMFYGCTGLTSFTMSSRVTDIGTYAFYGCTGLTSFTIGSGVKTIHGYAFQNCTGLITIEIPNNVTTLGNDAFSGCTGLTSVTIGSGVVFINNNTFQGCTGLITITIPNNVTTINNYAFLGCTKLTTVTIGSGLTTLDGYNIFENDASLSSFVVDASNANFSSFQGVLFNKPQTTLIIYPPGKIGSSYTFPTTVTTIHNQAFLNCVGLTTIAIPNIITDVGWNAFQGCTGLTSVTIGSGITIIDTSMFDGCTGLTSITFPNNVQDIQAYAFNGCTGLTTVTIGSGVTNIGNYAFQGCTGLTTITIPNNVTDIQAYAFQGCTGLTTVTIGSGVTSIWDYAFYNCNYLTTVTIGSGCQRIRPGAFANCNDLESVYFMGNIPIFSDDDEDNFTSNTSDTAYVLTSATLVDTKAPPGTTVTDYLKPKFFTNVVIQSSFLVSDICFRKGTPVRTDQGLIHIDKINPASHTIRNKKIVAITNTVTQEKYLVCFEKDCLGPNMPSQKTFISANHKIFNKGTMIKAKEFVGKYENIYKVKYTGEILYNVLMEEYDKIVVNNLICESLHPENTIAQLYKILQDFNLDEQQEIIKQYNEFTLKNKVSSSSSSSKK